MVSTERGSMMVYGFGLWLWSQVMDLWVEFDLQCGVVVDSDGVVGSDGCGLRYGGAVVGLLGFFGFGFCC